VLNAACRRFRSAFRPGSEPGSAHPHRRACAECAAYAAALECAAGLRLPLPAGLRRNLRAIGAVATPEPEAVLPFAVPRLAVPAPLIRRLRGLAAGVGRSSGPSRPPRPVPPVWILNPRYAVAASALLALLLAPLLAPAMDHGRQMLGAVDAEVSPLLAQGGEKGREEAGKLRESAARAAAACRSAGRSVESSLGRLDAGITDFSVRLTDVVAKNLEINLDPKPRAGSVRRPQ
jgi:hypothetical protein